MMDKVRRAGILGTGRYVPEKVVTNEDLSAMMDTLCFPMNPVRLPHFFRHIPPSPQNSCTPYLVHHVPSAFL